MQAVTETRDYRFFEGSLEASYTRRKSQSGRVGYKITITG